jgi:hypothetical protein
VFAGVAVLIWPPTPSVDAWAQSHRGGDIGRGENPNPNLGGDSKPSCTA